MRWIQTGFGVLFFCVPFCSNAQSIVFNGDAYDQHIELNWQMVANAHRYEIYRRPATASDFELHTTVINKTRYIDWAGRDDQGSNTYSYYIDAIAFNGSTLSTSDTITLTIEALDANGFMDMVQEHTFRYFWEHAHPVSGMARERLGSGNTVTTGGTGFGVMSILVAIHRGWITREQGLNRLLQMASFLQFADSYHGVYPHWMNGETGETLPFSQFDNGGDLVETAFLFQGLLTARAYFDQDIPKENALRSVITSLWEDVEWDFYTRNQSGVLYWHWSPEFEWQMNFPIRGYNEALIIYLLAIASPTHPVDASYWHTGWAGGDYENGFSWYGINLPLGPPLGGPLFFAHYSYQGFDPRNIKDQYANYFIQNRNHTLINRAWCINNPLHHEGYSAQCWGLTASDNPWGYFAHAPGGVTDKGVITPTAALSSMPYTPDESLEALIHFYREYGENLWGEYGFYDAFHIGENWFASSYLAIDQGPIVNMIENYRSQLLWSLFMSNPEIQPALDAIGFEPDSLTSFHRPEWTSIDWDVFPTLIQDELFVEFKRFSPVEKFSLVIYNMDGQVIYMKPLTSHNHVQRFDLSNIRFANGVHMIALMKDRHVLQVRQVVLQH